MKTSPAKKNLLIEGWRGINHSFALVNQCQILELLKYDDLQIFHRDLPFAMSHWNSKTLDAGFSQTNRERIAALTEPVNQPIDCVYRISSPFGGDLSKKTITFMITELGLSNGSFLNGFESPAAYTREGNLVVTSTKWSKDRLVEYGVDESKTLVIPCGVNTDTFYPLSMEERALNRSNLGLNENNVVFLNLAAPIWNKGVDILLIAFATLHARYKHLRLILKDQSILYGVPINQVLSDVISKHPGLFTEDTLAAMKVISGNLSQSELRLLYGVADCYVSPYRAEGFNLPVLESIACGTQVVVTDGGATDDFCTPEVSIRVKSTPSGFERDGFIARYCEPQMDALTGAMERFVNGPALDSDMFNNGRKSVLEKMSWQVAAKLLHALI